MNADPSPNMRANPVAQNMSEAMATTMKFLVRMLTAFFERQNPDSTSANPAFMKKTRNPAVMTHIVSRRTWVWSSGATASSAAAAWAAPDAMARAPAAAAMARAGRVC